MTRPSVAARTQELFAQEVDALHRRTDRLFVWLLSLQFIAGVAGALWLTPRTWIGATSATHPHVWLTIILGGAITALPIALAFLQPGAVITRHLIGASQVIWSALFIHITGGRIETHFHVFGSLAFLSLYRDYRVTLTATLVVAVDHLTRGLWFPESVFGVAASSNWRWLEHAGWVLFEDAILIPSCIQGLKDIRSTSERQALLEDTNAAIEDKVNARTSELRAANSSLAENQAALKTAYDELRNASKERETLHGRLVTASRQAGMAEVATGVLHNVGNVLNSVNVAAQLMSGRLRESEVESLTRVSDLLREHESNLSAFLETDERGRHIPRFIMEVAECLSREHKELGQELQSIVLGIEHVKHVVNLQQEHAKGPSMVEVVRPSELVNAALTFVKDSLTRHGIEVVLSLDTDNPLTTDKHQVIQVLVNLFTNARQAMSTSASKRLAIKVEACPKGDESRICFVVTDTGAGIPAEHLTRIFQHGFTTKADGHGFGLHSSAVAAQAMKGSLKAHSRGINHGATFTLALPAVSPLSAAAPGGT